MNKNILITIIRLAIALLFTICTIYLVINGIQGWGWCMIAAVIFGYFESKYE